MEFAASPFELKSLDESGRIAGVLADFTQADFGGDRLLPGCLGKSLASRTAPLPMLFAHDMRRPIGSWTRWNEEPTGLRVEGKITLATRDGAEAHALAKDRALTGLSIGWTPKRTAPGNDGERLVVEAELHEGSLVACPMNDRARVIAVKDFGSAKELADLFRQAGLSGRQAKVAAGAAWKAINNQSDEADAMDEVRRLFDEHSARLAGLGGQ